MPALPPPISPSSTINRGGRSGDDADSETAITEAVLRELSARSRGRQGKGGEGTPDSNPDAREIGHNEASPQGPIARQGSREPVRGGGVVGGAAAVDGAMPIVAARAGVGGGATTGVGINDFGLPGDVKGRPIPSLTPKAGPNLVPTKLTWFKVTHGSGRMSK